MIDAPKMFAMVNLGLCLIIVHVCLCRLNKMSLAIRLVVRSQYILYLNCALLSGLQPLWGEWPQWGAIAMAACLLVKLLVRTGEWVGGPPSYTYCVKERP